MIPGREAMKNRVRMNTVKVANSQLKTACPTPTSPPKTCWPKSAPVTMSLTRASTS